VGTRLPHLGSLVEWVAAALVATAVVWVGVTWASPWRTRAPAIVSVDASLVPAGVPGNAQSVPLLVLIDGTAIRVGDTQVDIRARLGEAPDDPEPQASRGAFGDRLTRTYLRQGTRFFLVCERTEPGGPVRISRIYLPR